MPKPKQPISVSIANPEALAAFVTAKYYDTLPLYRLVDIFGRGYLRLSRCTLAIWCIKAVIIIKLLVSNNTCLVSIAYARTKRVYKCGNPSSKSPMWVYRSNEVSKQVVVIYDYQAGRACAEEF